MKLGRVQIGLIGQMEFIKLGTIGSKGALDYASPYADDDRRDHEIHRRGRFGATLSVQTKVTKRTRPIRRAPQLQVSFFVAFHRLLSSRLYWYFFAHLDRVTMRFADPCFLVPSAIVHRHCRIGRSGSSWEFTFTASMAPGSHDRWVKYRVGNADIGTRVLSILGGLDHTEVAVLESARAQRIPGAIVVRRRPGAAR